LNAKTGTLTVIPSVYETETGETYPLQGVIH